jgi:hypothetical protein
MVAHDVSNTTGRAGPEYLGMDDSQIHSRISDFEALVSGSVIMRIVAVVAVSVICVA